LCFRNYERRYESADNHKIIQKISEFCGDIKAGLSCLIVTFSRFDEHLACNPGTFGCKYIGWLVDVLKAIRVVFNMDQEPRRFDVSISRFSFSKASSCFEAYCNPAILRPSSR